MRFSLAMRIMCEPKEHLGELQGSRIPKNGRHSPTVENTFTKRQRDNMKFILFLFENEEFHPYLHEPFLHELQNINTNIDYTEVRDKQRMYRKNGGKKSLQERENEYRRNLLRKHIEYSLNSPLKAPRTQTVDLPALEKNVHVFAKYIASANEIYNKKLRPVAFYMSLRVGLRYLFMRYKYSPSRQYFDDLKACIESTKSYSSRANLNHL